MKFNFLSKLSKTAPEVKGVTYSEYDFKEGYVSAGAVEISSIEIVVTPRMAYRLNDKNGDIGKAVGDIASALASLTKGVKLTSGDIDYKHPLVSLLNKPSSSYNKIQFFREIAESFLLTQEIYIVARGNVTRPPLELAFIRPYDVSITQNSNDVNPISIRTEGKADARTYKPEVINGVVRYIDATRLNELICIKGAVSTQDEWRGRSPLSKLYYDALLSIAGKRHNTSLLENGLRTSGIMSPRPESGEAPARWGDDQVNKLKHYITEFGQGAGNAGKFLVVGTPTEIQGLNMNNRDMDFVQLLQNSQVAVFNMYNVPLPLVLSTNMSYNNFTTANRTFYTKAVFPVFDQIAEGLLFLLRDRFGMTIDETLVYKDTDIRDLQPVMIENMKMLNETQAVSTNEVRRAGGFEDTEGGDDILVLANKVALSSITGPDAGMFDEPIDPAIEPVATDPMPEPSAQATE